MTNPPSVPDGPTAVIVLAAGGGTRMKSKTMKVLHPLGGRSMIGHVLAAVRPSSPSAWWPSSATSRDQVGRTSRRWSRRAVLAVAGDARTGTGHAVRRRAGGAARRTGTRHGGRRHRRHPAARRRETLRGLRRDHDAARQRGDRADRRGAPTRPATAGSSATRTATVAAIVEEKDATAEQRGDRARSTPASSPSTRRSCATRCRRSATTTPRASTTSPTSSRSRADAGPTGRAPTAIDDVMQTEGVNDRAQLADARPRAQPPDRSTALDARRRHRRGPRHHLGRRRRSCSRRTSRCCPDVQLHGATAVARTP